MEQGFLTTVRLSFRIWNEQCLENAMLLWTNPDICRFICANSIFSESEIKLRLEKEIENQKLFSIQYWPFYKKDTDEFLGCAGFRPYKEKNLEFGIHLRPEFWHKGYAYEAGSAAINYCIQNIDPQNIIAGHNPHNIASKKMLEKLGFVFTHNEFYQPTGLMHPTYKLKK